MFKKPWWVLRSEETGGEGSGGGTADGGTTASADTSTAESQGAEAGSTESGDNKSESAGYWPGDWREKWAGQDDKKLNHLKRFASPEAAFDALVAAQNKIRSGEYKAALPKDAKPEEVAQWRKDNGIPETPEGYELKFDNGLVIGDEDKGRVQSFLGVAHKSNYTPDQVKAAVAWSYEHEQKLTEERLAKDESEKEACISAMSQEWGHEYQQNKAAVANLMSMFPDDVRDLIIGGRLADGTGLFNHPQVWRGFAALARELNPAGTTVPGGSGSQAQSVDDEIASIEKYMRENRTAYYKDETKQARLRELYAAREKLKQRA